MQQANHKLIAETWFQAFNDKNLSLLLSLYHKEAQHYSPKLKLRKPETRGWIKGIEAMRQWWSDAFDRMPGLHYELLYMMADEQQVFMEYLRQNPGEEDIRVGEVLMIKDGKIVLSRVYHS